MQDRTLDFVKRNEKTFPEMAWKVQLAGENYPGRLIIYYIAESNYKLHGLRDNDLLFNKPKRRDSKTQGQRERKKLLHLTLKTVSQTS